MARRRFQRRQVRRRGGEQHERDDHREVLNDQPADGNAATLRLKNVPLLQSPDQDDRAGYRSARPKTSPAPVPQPSVQAKPTPSNVARDLRDRRRQRDSPD
jgi:hypothetical protein